MVVIFDEINQLCLPHIFQTKNVWGSWPQPLRMKTEIPKKITIEKSAGLLLTVQCGKGYNDLSLQDCGPTVTSDTKVLPLFIK